MHIKINALGPFVLELLNPSLSKYWDEDDVLILGWEKGLFFLFGKRLQSITSAKVTHYLPQLFHGTQEHSHLSLKPVDILTNFPHVKFFPVVTGGNFV